MSDDNTPDLDMPAIAPPDDAGPGTESNPVAEDAPLYRRVVSDGTRKLFAKAADALKTQLETEDADETVAIQPPDATPAAPAGSPAPQGSQGALATPLTPAGAAPAPDAAASRVALQLEVRERAIAERESKLVEREKSLEAQGNARDRYLDSSAKTIRELVKEWTGAASDDEVKDEIGDLITELSDSVLGLPVSPELKSRIDSRRAIRQVKSYKADLTKREQKMLEREEEAKQAAREQAASSALAERLRAVPADKYPHLMAEDDPHAIVWDVIKTKASRDPEWQPNWEEAAKLANDHFQKVHQGQHQKLSRLFTTTASTPVVAASPQGAAQSRAARTLTNAGTAAPVQPASPSEDEPYDRGTARRRSLGRLQAALKERTT